MDLIGHLAVAERSCAHAEREVFGPGVAELMMPNYLHCHDWAYGAVWTLDRFNDEDRPTIRRIRTHVVADWVIHYGDRRTDVKQKCGWAYRRMGWAHRQSRPFFAEARRRDLLRSEASNPDHWNKKRKLDFAHSMVEYAVDLILARETVTPSRLADLKRYLAAIGHGSGTGYATLMDRCIALGVRSDRTPSYVRRSIEALASDAACARNAEDFAVRTTLRKYGFDLSRASHRYVLGFLHDVAGRLDATEVRSLCSRIAELAAHPDGIYTGPWHA